MSSTFTMYSTPWCGYCHRLKGQLDREGIAFDVVDIEQDPEAAQIVESANNGNQTVPTLVYSDGTAQTNPSLAQVKAKLAELATAEPAPLPHHWPGSGPPYQCSTSDRLIETPPGSTRVPASARSFISARVNQRASSISCSSTVISVVERPGRRSRASGWPAAATAGCRSSRPRRPATPTSSATSRRTASSSVSPGSQKPASVEKRPSGHTDWRPSRQRSSSEPGSPRRDDHDHRRVGARELRVPVGAGQLVARLHRRQRLAAARAEAGDEEPLGQAERVEDQRRARHARRRRGRAAARAAASTPPSRPSRSRRRRSPRTRRGRRARRAAPAARRARRPARPSRSAPSTGLIRVPETTSTRVSGSAHRSSSQASSARRTPARSCGSADSCSCG